MTTHNTPFLKLVATDIYKRFNGNLNDIAIVFPNKRAGLFFNEYLTHLSGRPLWSPTYITISELFQQCSNAVLGDPILLVSKLYKEYVKYTHSSESIDSFYYWGEILIKDFDDIDKNLVKAGELFANLNDLKSLGSASDTLDEEQREAIEQFFKNFNPGKESELKRRFLHIWHVMNDIYVSFKEQLRSEGIAYEGMMYRDVLEQEEGIQLPYRQYIFVGFNALNKVESTLFDTIRKAGKALFYWDYDMSYIADSSHEAGHFMRRNLGMFPNALENGSYDNICNKKIDIVSTTTDSIQMRYASQWIKEHWDKEREVETAVVLCDESKLESVYHIIPDDVQERNITMGFPVSHTPIFDLIKQLVELQTVGYDEQHGTFGAQYVCTILNHPYIKRLSSKARELIKEITENRILFPPLKMYADDELLNRIFTIHDDNTMWMLSIGDIVQTIAKSTPLPPKNDNDEDKKEADIYNELFLEAELKAFTQTQRLVHILDNSDLILAKKTLGSLLLRVLSSATIPFHGEPVVGMQIMGLLETRNLDFKNIIFLSANEGNLPKGGSDTSFIPYNLRRAFGLTLSEHRDSIYAYNFYRLLQRAENVTIVYNGSNEGTGRNGCSRYILQLMANGQCGEKYTLTSQQTTSADTPIEVKKTKEIIEELRGIYDNSNGKGRALSPSAINCYIDCSLRFFYRYVMKLKKYEQLETGIKGNDFGLIFHKAAELFYDEVTGKNNGTIERGDLLPYLEEDARLYKFVDDAFKEEFFKGTPVYDGEQYMNREIIHRLLKRLVQMDIKHTPFEYVGSEKDIFFDYTVELSDGLPIKLSIGGRIDRIDRKDGILEIIDYKTGGKEGKVEDLAKVFTHDGKSLGYVFQALLYSVAALEKGITDKVLPSLIYIHRKDGTNRNDYVVKIADKQVEVGTIREEFKQSLKALLKEIFDTETPFIATDKEENCTYCDFKRICGR